MDINKISGDLLIINTEGQVILRVGKAQGRLIQNEGIVATITKVLFLFSRKVIEEPINFIRFQNHRMIFTYSESSKLFAVKLVPKEALARSFVPGMKVILNSTSTRYLSQNLGESSYSALANYYYTISANPEDVSIISTLNIEGITSLIIVVSGLVYDLGWPIDTLLQKTTFIDKDGKLIDPTIQYNSKYVLSIGASPIFEENVILTTIGTNTTYDILPRFEEELYKTCAKLFGIDTAADKFSKLIDTDVQEVIETLLKLPLKQSIETIKKSILGAISDPSKIVVSLSEPLIAKLAELEGGTSSNIIKSDVSQRISDKEVVITEDETDSILREMTESFESASSRIHQAAETSAVTESITSISVPSVKMPTAEIKDDINLKQVEIPPTVQDTTRLHTSRIDLPEITTSQPMISRAFLKMTDIPVTVNTSSYLSGLSQLHKIKSEDIQIELLAPENGYVHVLVNVKESRTEEYINSIMDLLTTVSGEASYSDGTVVIKMPEKFLYVCLRALIWSVIVEYLNQVAEGMIPKVDSLKFPNTGSIMLIPPAREYDREKLPRQVVAIVSEDKLIAQLETESIHTTPIVIETMIKNLMGPLRAGSGVALVPRKNSQELAEITLSLILISEITGVAFSRW